MEENTQLVEKELLEAVAKLKKGIAKIEQASRAYEEAKNLMKDNSKLEDSLAGLEHKLKDVYKRLEELQTNVNKSGQQASQEQMLRLQVLSEELEQAVAGQRQLISNYTHVAKELSENIYSEIEALKESIRSLHNEVLRVEASSSKNYHTIQDTQKQLAMLIAKEKESSAQIARLKSFLTISIVLSLIAIMIAIFS
jgi:chromosome segregation ATPase